MKESARASFVILLDLLGFIGCTQVILVSQLVSFAQLAPRFSQLTTSQRIPKTYIYAVGHTQKKGTAMCLTKILQLQDVGVRAGLTSPAHRHYYFNYETASEMIVVS